MSLLWRLAQTRRGATAVEFALVVIPLMIFIMGGFEFGRLLWTKDVLQQAATAGARCMGLNNPACQAHKDTKGIMQSADYWTKDYTTRVASGYLVALGQSAISLNTSSDCVNATGAASSGSMVTLTLPFSTAVPGLVNALSGTQTLEAVACFPNQS